MVTLTAPELVPEDDGVVALDVWEAGADVAEEGVMVGRISMEIGVVLEGATDAGVEVLGAEVVALAAGADGALPAGAAAGALSLEPAADPDDATPLTGPQVPVKVPESEALPVTSASGPGFG